MPKGIPNKMKRGPKRKGITPLGERRPSGPRGPAAKRAAARAVREPGQVRRGRPPKFPVVANTDVEKMFLIADGIVKVLTDISSQLTRMEKQNLITINLAKNVIHLEKAKMLDTWRQYFIAMSQELPTLTVNDHLAAFGKNLPESTAIMGLTTADVMRVIEDHVEAPPAQEPAQPAVPEPTVPEPAIPEQPDYEPEGDDLFLVDNEDESETKPTNTLDVL